MSALLQQMMADSPVALWPCDEGTGTSLSDRTGNGRTGTTTGTVSWSAKTFFGRPALDLQGGYATVAHHASFDIATTGELTVEGWCLLDALAATNKFPALLAKTIDQAPGSAWALYPTNFYASPTSTGVSAVIGKSGGNVVNKDSGTLALGVWHQVAMTYVDSTKTIRLVVDGEDLGTAVGSGTVLTNTDQVTIGATFSDHIVDGAVSHVAVYPSSLSTDRLKAHYQAGIRSGIVGG